MIKDCPIKDWKKVLNLDNGRMVYWLPKTNMFLVVEYNGLYLPTPTKEEIKEIMDKLVWKGEEE